MSSPYAGRRVLLVDAVDEDPTGHAPLRRRALERLGCTVHVLDPRQKRGLMARFRSSGVAERLGRGILEHQPDLVLVVEGADLTAGNVLQLKREGRARFANWFIGTARSLALMEAVSPAYDALFVPGSDLAERLRGPARAAVLHLAPGCDPSVHRPVPARDQFRANVVFVGEATPRREQLLGGLAEYGLAIWGAGWRRTALHDYCRGEHLSSDDFVRAYAGASVAVNVHREVDGSTATGCNQRLFEVAAIGVPQVVDARPDLALHFLEGSEVLTFDGSAALKAHVGSLLHDTVAAERLSHAARQRALAEHTYMHRMTAILAATLGAGD